MTKHVFRTMMLLLACSAMIFAGCKKDDDSSDSGGGGNAYEGVFNPSQKISGIYHNSPNPTDTTYLQEKWEWDENNRLKRITYNNTPSGWYVQTTSICNFTFNSNNQIVRSIVNDYYSFNGCQFKTQYEYDANHQLKKITTDRDGEMLEEAIVTERQNGKIHKIESTTQSGKLSITILTWDGNNISKIEYDNGDYITYTYDNKNNPYYQPYYSFSGFETFAHSYSKNNILTEVRYNNGLEFYHNSYEYEYNDNGFPTIINNNEYYEYQ